MKYGPVRDAAWAPEAALIRVLRRLGADEHVEPDGQSGPKIRSDTLIASEDDDGVFRVLIDERAVFFVGGEPRFLWPIMESVPGVRFGKLMEVADVDG